jgi:phospholipase/carboxylesterase
MGGESSPADPSAVNDARRMLACGLVKRRLALSAFALLFAACQRAAPSPAPGPSPEPLAATVAADGSREAAGVRYLERVTGGGAEGDALPLVIGIHGYGDRPESYAGLFEGFSAKARFIFPYGEPEGEGFSWFAVSPRFNPDAIAAGTERAAHRLAAMIAALSTARPTVGRPIVTGFSQGGMLSYALAVLHPESVGEAFPVGGLLTPPHWPSTWAVGKAQARIEAFHGDADPRVPIAVDRQGAARLRAVGFSVELHEYPGVVHTITPEMRRDLLAALGAATARAAATPR